LDWLFIDLAGFQNRLLNVMLWEFGFVTFVLGNERNTRRVASHKNQSPFYDCFV
jgi:hypothetical protein